MGIESKGDQFQTEKTDGTLKGETSELGFRGQRVLRSLKRNGTGYTMYSRMEAYRISLSVNNTFVLRSYFGCLSEKA